MPKLLHAAGYQTALVGKWHLESNPTGFDFWDILIGQGRYYNPPMIRNGKRTPRPGYVTDIITATALDWLKNEVKPQDVAAFQTASGPNAMYRSVDLRTACCTIRKVEPLKRKLATLDAWIAGLRREQWVSRRNIAKVELDREHGGIVKLNPLADWTLDRVWDYIRDNEVPYHELFDRGFAPPEESAE